LLVAVAVAVMVVLVVVLVVIVHQSREKALEGEQVLKHN
jgi:cell division protein FtsN